MINYASVYLYEGMLRHYVALGMKKEALHYWRQLKQQLEIK